MINKKNTNKVLHKAIILPLLLIAFVFLNSGFPFEKNVAEAKKKKSTATKWQKLLERNNIDPALWQKYLPKVSKGEYGKVKKALKRIGIAGSGSLGPEMKVGLFKLSSSNSKRIEITATGNYTIKNWNGILLDTGTAGSKTRIKADYTNEQLSIKGLNVNNPDLYVDVGDYLVIEPNAATEVLEIVDCQHQTGPEKKADPNGCYYTASGTEYNKFRGKLIVSFNKDGVPWVVNSLPMEQYTWGTGEIGDSEKEYYKLFSIIFRTYGYYHNQKRTKHADENFTLTDTSSDQIYKGYMIEEKYPKMKEAAQETRGKIVTYESKTALTPYCSYTDGKTRNYPGDDFPYLKSVKDHKKGTDKSLDPGDNGNHMYGLSAHGAVGYIGDGKSFEWVLKHYYSGVKIEGAY